MEELLNQLIARTNQRIAFAGKSSAWLARAFRLLQARLFSLFVSRYLDGLFPPGATKMAFTATGAINAARVSMLVETEYKAQASGLLAGIAARMIRSKDYSREYFTLLGMEEPEAETAIRVVMQTYGYDTRTGTIIPGGYLDGVLGGAPVAQVVVQQIREGMAAGMGRREFIAKFRAAFLNPAGTGMLERHFARFTHDFFMQYDRVNSIMLAKAAGMDHFIYAGTAVEDSREFCLLRLNRAYDTTEAKKWDSQEWAGKIPDVPVLQQLGGYNCRHALMFVSEEMAKMLEAKYGPINGYNKLPTKKAKP